MTSQPITVVDEVTASFSRLIREQIRHNRTVPPRRRVRVSKGPTSEPLAWAYRHTYSPHWSEVMGVMRAGPARFRVTARPEALNVQIVNVSALCGLCGSHLSPPKSQRHWEPGVTGTCDCGELHGIEQELWATSSTARGEALASFVGDWLDRYGLTGLQAEIELSKVRPLLLNPFELNDPGLPEDPHHDGEIRRLALVPYVQ